MGSRGVLLSNFQPELAEYFNDGQDLILYNDLSESWVIIIGNSRNAYFEK